MPSVALTHELSFTSTTVGQQLVFPLLLRGNGPRITADWLQWAAFSLDPPGKHPAGEGEAALTGGHMSHGRPKGLQTNNRGPLGVFLFPEVRCSSLLLLFIFTISVVFSNDAALPAD